MSSTRICSWNCLSYYNIIIVAKKLEATNILRTRLREHEKSSSVGAPAKPAREQALARSRIHPIVPISECTRCRKTIVITNRIARNRFTLWIDSMLGAALLRETSTLCLELIRRRAEHGDDLVDDFVPPLFAICTWNASGLRDL